MPHKKRVSFLGLDKVEKCSVWILLMISVSICGGVLD